MLRNVNKTFDFPFSWYAAHDARLDGGGIWIAAQDVAGEYIQVMIEDMKRN